ncbi:hypothetical protein AB0N38_10640 [Micromonospora aurantiaca]|uniref:hypothetical protein n=1 Tax=Micromonospora aurantiaca (nom. illeg.) TaxID=47850 RepID=UPI0034322BE6
MRNLTVPADVAVVIGAQRAAELEAGPYPADYRCVYCHQLGRADDGQPLTTGADVGAGNARARVWFAHQGCGPGGVKLVSAEPPQLDESVATGVMYAGYGGDGRAWPCLVVELAMSVETVQRLGDDDTERVDQVLATVLERGMRPTAEPLNPPAPDGPICWRVQLPRGGRHAGGVYGRNRLLLLEPLPPIPAGWLDLVAYRGGRCGLYVVSRFGLLAVLESGPDIATALAHAGRTGRLVGATAAVIP